MISSQLVERWEETRKIVFVGRELKQVLQRVLSLSLSLSPFSLFRSPWLLFFHRLPCRANKYFPKERRAGSWPVKTFDMLSHHASHYRRITPWNKVWGMNAGASYNVEN